MNSDLQDEPAEALFHHCVATYNKMMEHAKEILLPTDDIDGRIALALEETPSMIVYEGMLTRLITSELHLSTPYYTSITRTLKAMGCIRSLRRGGGSAPSQWELVREPTREEFELRDDSKANRPKKVDRSEMLQDQINALNNRVNALEKTLEELMNA